MKDSIFSRKDTLYYIAFIFAVFFVGVGVLPDDAQAVSYERAPELRIFSEMNGYQPINSFYAYDSGFTGGGAVAINDLGIDGTNEIITAAGLGGAPHVRIFRIDGSFVNQFYAYDENMHAGINISAGDVDGDGRAEIITAPQEGGGPHVRVFDGSGQIDGTVGFYAYDENYHGGVNVAVGDVDGDGRDDIVTGNGVDGASHVRVFSGNGTWLGKDYRPFAEDLRGGVSVAVGNVDGGDEAEIIMAVQSGDEAWIKVYKYDDAQTIIGEFRAFDESFKGGINVAAGDVDSDGEDEVVVSVNGVGGPQIKIFEAHGEEINPGFFAYEEDFWSGVNIAVGQTDDSSREEIITMPSKLKPEGRTDVDRYVDVNITTQTLTAYEHGYKVNEFLVSTGLWATPTPINEFHIQRKLYSHLYSGPGYYLPNTLYNLQFTPGYYLHGAYWHNNFGHRMSHGCINISYTNASWLYDWMQVGDLVVTHY